MEGEGHEIGTLGGLGGLGTVGSVAGRGCGVIGEVDAACRERWAEVTVRVAQGTPVEEVVSRLQAVWVRSLLEAAAEAMAAINRLDVGSLDADGLGRWADGVEQVRRSSEAAGAAVAARLETDNPYRRQGFFSARSWLRHRLALSGPEAHRRTQVGRMRRRLDAWSAAMDRGVVGVAQHQAMARVAANPRIPEALLRRDQHALLDDAMSLPFDEFERRLRTWEALADPAGDEAASRRQVAARSLRLRPRPEGGWTVSGFLDELAGSELGEILAHFEEAEWRSDWAEARARLGDRADTADAARTVEPADLARTTAQRRADALLALARAAATAAPGARSRPTVNVLIDEHSFHAALQGDRIEPAEYRRVICRTRGGRRLHRDEAVNAALVGHVRRAVVDAAGVVVDLGRRARLFRGNAREAAMLLATHCVWLGCEQPVAWCETDHSTAWRAHGATVPRNGAPMCRRHQLHKERGFQVFRDEAGAWRLVDPDGRELV